jgi:hypothetical protein
MFQQQHDRHSQQLRDQNQLLQQLLREKPNTRTANTFGVNYNTGAPNRPDIGNAKQWACFNCGQTDHRKRDCPFLNSTGSGPSYNPNAMREPMATNTSSKRLSGCFHCGQPGHVARSCPMKV